MSEKSYWIAGHHAVRSILQSAPERVLSAACSKNHDEAAEFKELLDQAGVAVQQVDKVTLQKLVGSEQHQGVALQVRARKEQTDADLMRLLDREPERSNWLILVLDQVQDPHNLGACLRTAEACGVDAVVVPKDRSAPMSAVVHKVASGAAETLEMFRVTNLARTLKELKTRGVWVVGTSDQAQHTIYAQDFTQPIALIMGAEGKGLRRLTEDACDVLLSIPMASTAVSSLNVSVATGVCLYEAIRQRQK